MVIINLLDKHLDPRPLGNFSGTHFLGYLQWVTLNASYNSMSIRAILCTVIDRFNDYDFLASMTSRENDGHLAGFDEFDHLCFSVKVGKRKDVEMDLGREEEIGEIFLDSLICDCL